MLVFDPSGWAAFGPLKWAAVSTLALAAAASMWLRPFIFHPPSTVGWIAFLGWAAVCAASGLDPVYSWIGTPDRHLGWFTWVIFGLIFLVGQNLAASSIERPNVVTLARSATLATAGLSLYSFAEMAGFAPVDLVVESDRVGGPFGSPAYLGAACVLLLPMTAALVSDTGEKTAWRRIALGALLGGIVALVASQTRAAWLGVAVSALVIAPRWWPRVRARWWLMVPIFFLVIMVTPIASRLGALLADDAHARADEWRMGAAVISTAPVLGVGPEGYRLAFPSVVDADYERRYTRQSAPDRAHNGALDTAAMFGVPGLAAYGAGAIFLGIRSLKAVKSRAPLLVGSGAAVIGYLVHQQFLFPVAEIDVIFWLAAGVVVASTGPMQLFAKPSVAVTVLLGSLAVVALLGGALDVAADRLVLNSLRDASGGTTGAVRATTLRPDSIRYWLAAADARSRAGQLEPALQMVDRAISISPLDPILMATKGRLLLARASSTGTRDDLDRVVDYYEHLLSGDPHNAQNQLRAGSAYALAGAFAEAEAALLAAADLAPSSAVPHANLARLYLTTGDPTAAASAYRRAVSIDPGLPDLDEIALLLEAAAIEVDE